jgi:hypothetical protein
MGNLHSLFLFEQSLTEKELKKKKLNQGDENVIRHASEPI